MFFAALECQLYGVVVMGSLSICSLLWDELIVVYVLDIEWVHGFNHDW